MEIIQKLNQFKKKIEEAKQKKARKEGQYEELMQTLKTFNCNSIEEAEKIIEETLQKKEEKEKLILSSLKKLEDNDVWEI